MNKTISNRADTKQKKGLKAKDVITLAIFSVLFVVICFIGIGIMSMLVVTQPFGLALGALIGGMMYMYMRVKVQRFGGILLTGAITALFMFITGGGWIIPICIMLGALIAEGIAAAGKYHSFWLYTLGFVVFMVFFAIGSYMPMVMMKDTYLELALSNSVNNAFMIDLLNYFTGPVLAGALAVTAGCSVAGALIGRGIFKKHFKKAGMM